MQGKKNYVHVRVTNRGKAPAFNARVDFHWCDPNAGITDSSWKLIGRGYVTLQTMESRVVRCPTPWVPEGTGHQCLLAQCEDPLKDRMTSPFHPWLDRHAGQRNVTVLAASEAGDLSFHFLAGHVFAQHQELVFAVERAPLAELAPLAMTLGLKSLPMPFDKPADVQIRQAAARPRARESAAANVAELTRSVAVHPVAMRSKEVKPFVMKLTLPDGALAGQGDAYRIVQRRNGQIVGGYTVIITG